MNDSVSTLPVSNRCINALRRAGAFTIGEALALPIARLENLRGVGETTISQITHALKNYDIYVYAQDASSSEKAATKGAKSC
jgi:DNA-directed RNA polymerase alpha subunit